MTKKYWKQKIKKACVEAGTYQPFFDAAINTLSEIMEQRDHVFLTYQKTGGMPIITHTNKGGAENPAKNPLLVQWDDLGKSALAYWRDLGLTPSGYKKVVGDAPTNEKASALAEALKSIGA